MADLDARKDREAYSNPTIFMDAYMAEHPINDLLRKLGEMTGRDVYIGPFSEMGVLRDGTVLQRSVRARDSEKTLPYLEKDEEILGQLRLHITSKGETRTLSYTGRHPDFPAGMVGKMDFEECYVDGEPNEKGRLDLWAMTVFPDGYMGVVDIDVDE